MSILSSQFQASEQNVAWILETEILKDMSIFISTTICVCACVHAWQNIVCELILPHHLILDGP